jgi:predicted ester cyclase
MPRLCRSLAIALCVVMQATGLKAQTSPREATALARAVFAAMDRQDFAQTGSLLDPSFRLHYQGVPDPISRQAFLEMLRGYVAPFPDLRHDLQDILPSGDRVTVRVVVHGTHSGPYEGVAATRRKVSVEGIHILRIARGKVVEWWAAEDDLGLLRQIGMLIKPPMPQE